MSRTWASIPEDEKNRLSIAFRSLADLDQLVLSSDIDEAENNRVTFSDLMQFIVNPDMGNGKIVSKALNTDLSLRRDFDVLLAQMSVCHMSAVAAADSDEVVDRKSGPFSVKIRPSSRGVTDVYLLVENRDLSNSDLEIRLYVRNEDGHFSFETMPPAVNGVSQKLISKDSDLVRALANVATTIDIL